MACERKVLAKAIFDVPAVSSHIPASSADILVVYEGRPKEAPAFLLWQACKCSAGKMGQLISPRPSKVDRLALDGPTVHRPSHLTSSRETIANGPAGSCAPS